MTNPSYSLFDIEAEESLLGCMVFENEVTDLIRTVVDESDFSSKQCSKIFSSYLRMRDSGETFTEVTVPADCYDVGSRLGNACSSSNAKYYALRIARASRLRELKSISSVLVRECDRVNLSNESDADHFFSEWQDKFVRATTVSRRKSSQPLSDVCREVFDTLEFNSKNRGQLRGSPMGISIFDELCRGMRKSDTYIISARAGVGKTALMLNTLLGAARAGSKTLVFSYEMKPAMLVQRMLTASSRVLGSKLDSGDISEVDMAKLSNALSGILPLPIWFEEKGTINDIKSAAIEHHRTSGLDLLVVDHIGLVDAIGRSPSREREVADISRGLKSLATGLNIPILILAQLNRQSDPTQEPMLSELRESGSLEQDASVVFMLWANPDNEAKNEVQWKLAKNRHGVAGRKGVLSFYRDIQLITDKRG